MSKTRLMTLFSGSALVVCLWQAPAFAEEPKDEPKQEETKKAEKSTAKAQKKAKDVKKKAPVEDQPEEQQ